MSTDNCIDVSDWDTNRVHVYDHQANPKHTIPKDQSLALYHPRGICVDSTGQWLFVGHGELDNYIVSIASTDGTNIQPILEVGESVYSLALYKHKYLAVGTGEGPLLYDIQDVV